VRGLAFTLCSALMCSLASAQSPAPSSGATARDGVYTAAQADRGSEAYTTACAHCHATDLQGDIRKEIPGLTEADFFVRWENRSLAELFETISKDMPMDRPGTLSERQSIDILAYILQVNKFPSGARELSADAARLKQVMVGSRSQP
jgi:cytochrome c